MRWTHAEVEADQAGTRRFEVYDRKVALTWSQILAAWKTPRFAAHFGAQLVGAGFQTFRWETPCLSSQDWDSTFEYVLADAPELQVPADPRAFKAKFVQGQSVVSFDNLGGDATLIVPCGAASDNFGHFANFLRTADSAQIVALWHAVSSAIVDTAATRPVWLNTAGGGVPWLHVRLDSSPKYYRYASYL